MDDAIDIQRPRTRRRVAWRAAAGIVVIAGGSVLAVIALQRNGAAPAAAAPAVATGTATVARTSLSTVDQVSGTLKYTGTYTLTGGLTGTLTRIAAEGATLKRGDVIAEVDGRPVYLMYGDRPAWRGFQSGMSDGPDVAQLDRNLIALGYATAAQLTPSNHYSAYDIAAVERWQTAMGLTADGTIPAGQIQFLTDAVRVGKHHAEPGAMVQGAAPVADATSVTRGVVVALDTAKEGEVKLGQPVTVTLPDGSTAKGKVDSIGTVATSSGGGNGGSSTTSVEVDVSLTDQSALGTLDGAPVSVDITTATARDVLAVPIIALTVTADGHSAVDVVGSGGAVRRVPVTTGMYSDTMVEIRDGAVHEGDTVVVPQT
ncbi:MAG TPA: peptidoglycan-binding protein [Candidatus Angelobacter sp.]|jgi:multidrug efflux pump subunit AcrA (membrane-fusion protein)|nr:peptidoglycan-binding protein [Candidatus Angelobacter sp.]